MRLNRVLAMLSSRGLRFVLAALLLSGASAAARAAEVDPLDWPSWRGPEQNGISRETGLIDSWSPDGKNVLWQNDQLGSRSTPIVLRGKIYTICSDQPGTPQEREKVACADANTGEILWENKFNVYLSDVPKERLGWSCCAGDPATGRIYAMGVCDNFMCLDGDTGETLWLHSLNEEYGFLNTYGGRTNTPVIFEDLVIISAVVIGWGEMAMPAHRYVAFNKETGEAVWFNGTRLRPDDTTYSVPVTTVLGGQAALVFGSGDGGVYAFQPRTGKQIWNFQLSQRGINISPVVVGDTVYMSHSEENPGSTKMGAMVALNGALSGDLSKSGVEWLREEVMDGKSSPLVIEGRVYAMDDGNALYVFDAATGKPIGKKARLVGTIARASLLYADGKIYACTTSAWHVLEPTKDGLKVVHRLRFGQGEEVHGSPIVSHGRVYLPTTEKLYCLADPDGKTGVEKRPAAPQEDDLDGLTKPTQVQVVPVESLIRPGDAVNFKVRLYNERGQFLKEVDDAEFEVSAGGEIDGKGAFTAADNAGHVGAIVTVKVGELTGTARVRIVPPLPWQFSFDDGQIPVTWVGMRYRHIALDDELYLALKDKNPRAAELYIYLMTSFTNSPAPKASFNDRTPRRTWTELLRYLGLIENERVKTLDGAKGELAEALDLLKEERVVADWALSSKGPGDIALDATRGDRKLTEGNPVMVKISTIPKGTRSQGWMGQTGFHDYTVQADVRGNVKEGQLPDIGLIAQRYTIDMMGGLQQLQIRSWTSELGRFSKTIPFSWKPDVWYTIKFQASTEDGAAVLKAKVWPRGETEPEAWTVEAVDKAPNLQGSPGLFGNASDAEIFLDNITVTAN
ncbi:MAG TPA: PQQ-binding-like beta-propeller repeat protein [Pirellulales bacterium]|nr:PQQ-binding-like beta-propeller repeat protein [Pirellulales bacterium]